MLRILVHRARNRVLRVKSSYRGAEELVVIGVLATLEVVVLMLNLDSQHLVSPTRWPCLYGTSPQGQFLATDVAAYRATSLFVKAVHFGVPQCILRG